MDITDDIRGKRTFTVETTMEAMVSKIQVMEYVPLDLKQRNEKGPASRYTPTK